jgi:nickel-dependent lactate racemase
VTILIGTGTHRPNTPEEIASMFGPEVGSRVQIVNHDAYDPAACVDVGTSGCGTRVLLNRAYVEADRRIAVGFIEPHFFAGFSGGPKAVAPGVAGIETIYTLHRAELIGHPNSTWGVLDENLLHREVREAVSLCPPEFLVNVTLNGQKEITGFYLGHYLEAHRRGCEDVRAASMVPVPEPFPLVVTSNSGFPLDQNLYQTVKGISAAARVTADGGTILAASECCDGVPDHGKFAELMKAGQTPADIVQAVYDEEPVLDQWQAQVLGEILKRVTVQVHSAMPSEAIRDCKMEPVADLAAAVRERVGALGGRPRAAVLPDGPLTIPYLSEA